MHKELNTDIQWTFDKTAGSIMFEKSVEYQKLSDEFNSLKKQVICSYVGSCLAQIFVDNPEISSITVTADSYPEYNDEGGTFDVYTANISFEFNVSEDEIDLDHFEQIASEFEDEGSAYEYHQALSYLPGNSYEMKGTIYRVDVENLLLEEKISGKFIYAKLGNE